MSRLPKPCAEPGCPEVTRQTRCAGHRRTKQADTRAYRGSAASRGYDRNHRKWRRRVLARDPLCVECLEDGRVTEATVADHKVPLSEGGARFDMDNGQGLCVTHHNRKTARERTGV